MTTAIAIAAPFGDTGRGPRPNRRLPALPFTGARLNPHSRRHAARAADAGSTPPGPIGAAIIRATRRSRRLSQRALAQRLAVARSTLHGWEAGTIPLFCTDFGLLRKLAAALEPAGGDERHMLHTLLLASQCDLLLTGMLRGFEDYAEVPPIDEDTTDGETARRLLRWALTGTAPTLLMLHAPTGHLIAQWYVTRIRVLALLIQAGAHSPDLKAFGCTLAMLTKPRDRE